jgi:hypothetical protein
MDDDLDMQAEWLAHDLWSFGVTIQHKGKCVADNESSYENRCEPCQEVLIRAARDMVAEGWRKPE